MSPLKNAAVLLLSFALTFLFSSACLADWGKVGILMVNRARALTGSAVTWEIVVNGSRVGSVGNGEAKAFKVPLTEKGRNTLYIQEVWPEGTQARLDAALSRLMSLDAAASRLTLPPFRLLGQSNSMREYLDALSRGPVASRELQFDAKPGAVIALRGGYRSFGIKEAIEDPTAKFEMDLSVGDADEAFQEPLTGLQVNLAPELLERVISREIVKMPPGTKMKETRKRTITRSIDVDTTAAAELKVKGAIGAKLVAMLEMEIAGKLERKWGKRTGETETFEKTIEIDGNIAPVVEITWVLKYCKGAADLKLKDVETKIPFETPVSLELRCEVPSKSDNHKRSEKVE